jgi:hypothetical protein
MKVHLGLVLLLALQLLVAGCAENRRRAGTGDVAFRLTWDGLSDLDLFVQDPSCDCISYISPGSPAGGILDVDCNGGTDLMCDLPIENVYWPVSTAPNGEYWFWVSAHAVIPGGEPVAFQIQVLRGREVAWLRKGSLQKSEEVYGPFIYSFPTGKIAGPLTGHAALPQCGIMRFMPPNLEDPGPE